MANRYELTNPAGNGTDELAITDSVKNGIASALGFPRLSTNGKLKLRNPTQAVDQYVSVTGANDNETITISDTP